MATMERPATLKRSIGPGLLTLYGLGTILGAGVYVLIGEVTAVAGTAAPSAFVIAAVLAGVTALSFAELSSRVPKSAGEAAYVDAAFDSRFFSRLVGWAVVAVGIVSAATMVRGFVGYFDVFLQLPEALVVITIVVVLGLVAAWGINESLLLAALITVLEILGLLLVCFVARDSLSRLPNEWTSLLPTPDTVGMSGVVSGAFLAFYAYIGFEDMVNVAEEVRDPGRTLPVAIVLALVVSTTVYMLVATVAVLAVAGDAIAGSSAPLAVIVESRGMPPHIIAGISLFAVINGALVQIIMASRVLYGLGAQGLAWRPLSRINARTRTPVVGTCVVTFLLLLLALFFSLGGLARATSFMALAIFAAVNAALWRLKKSSTTEPRFEVPTLLPRVGLVLSIAMLSYEAWRIA